MSGFISTESKQTWQSRCILLYSIVFLCILVPGNWVLVLGVFQLSQNKPGKGGVFRCVSLYFGAGYWYWVYFNCVKTKLAERERKQVSSTGINTQAELGNLLQLFYAFQLYFWMHSHRKARTAIIMGVEDLKLIYISTHK